MTETLTALDGGTCPTWRPVRRPQVRHFVFDRRDGKPGHRRWILAVLARAVAPLLRPGLAELGVSAEIATDGAAACAELKGASS